MNRTRLTFVIVALVVTVGLAMIVSPFASSSPDGLEKVAAEEGFEETAADHALGDSPLADYGVSGVDDERVSTALAGLVGVVITLAVAYGISRTMSGRRHHRDTGAPTPAGPRR
ncbi:MAG: PDGLE domain-containing protein [Actinomycetota bacterium]|nr:PDGLE domain-containing protein [Actinomycetota bacterium]